VKFAPKNNDRTRTELQWAFCAAIRRAAISWKHAGRDAADEWAEFYAFVLEAAP
jgi:hypothetical protein